MDISRGLAGLPPLHRSRTGALLVRLTVVGVVGGLAMYGPHGSRSPGHALGLLLAAVALGAFDALALRPRGEKVELLGHYLGDVALLAAATWLEPGYREQIAPLYLLVVAAAGAAAGIPGGLACGTLAAVAYPAVVWLGPAYAGVEVDGSRVTVLSLVLLLVGSLAGVLAEQERHHRTALEEARDRLERMQLDTESIVRSMSSGMMTVDSAGVVAICNPAAREILGLGGEPVGGRPLRDVLTNGLEPFARMLEEAVQRGTVWQRAEVDLVRGNSKPLPLGVSVSLLQETEGGRRGAVAVFQDLTDARERMRRIRRMETLASVGELSAGVAHEIRNCLNPITGCIELLRTEIQVTGEAERLMDLITGEGERLNRFIGELLDFARMDQLHPSSVDVSSLLEEVARLLECHPKRQPSIEVRCETDGPAWAEVDAEQLKRVFLNLGLNALEAMPEGGVLSLKLTAPHGGRGDIAIAFEDEGHGIRADHLPQVFEPFFTTKPKGTGLGLSLARQVVERHGGRVLARNRDGKGASFKISIPTEAIELGLARAS